MRKSKAKQNKIAKPRENSIIVDPSITYDFSAMSIDELLDSVRADIIPPGEEKITARKSNAQVANETEENGQSIAADDDIIIASKLPEHAKPDEDRGAKAKAAQNESPNALAGASSSPHAINQPSKAQRINAKDTQVSMPRSRRWDETGDNSSIALKRRRRFGYYKVLLLFMVVMVVITCVGTVLFWRYIEAYEASLPEHVIRHLQENIDYDFWENIVEEAITPLLTEFESEGFFSKQPYLSKIRDVSYTIRQKTDESSNDSLVYVIRAGALDIGAVHLIPTEDLGYGFFLWDIDEVSLLDSFVEALMRSVSITVSQNAKVEINGIPVSDAYRIHCDFEHGATYLVESVFGDVDISVVEFNGLKSYPYYAENGEFFYNIINPFSRSFNIVVPEGAAVYIDDDIIAVDRISDSHIILEILEGIVNEEEPPVVFVRYEFEQEGFYEEPTVSAVGSDGINLESEALKPGEMFFSEGYSEEYKELYEATVETFIRSYIRFGANIGNDYEANYSALAGYILRNSDLHRRVQASMSGIQYVSNTTVVYNSLDIDNFRKYGEDYFSCEVRYSITNRTYYEAREYEASYEILFVQSGNRWLAAKMVSLA